MNPLAALFAAPAAASAAVDAASSVASSVAQPFADIFSALSPASGSDGDCDDENGGLLNKIAERLQDIFSSAGAEPGDTATVSFDAERDELEIRHAGAWSDEGADAIANDDTLMAMLRQIAQQGAGEQDDNEPLDLFIEVA